MLIECKLMHNATMIMATMVFEVILESVDVVVCLAKAEVK